MIRIGFNPEHLIAIRHLLHSRAELSGSESGTESTIREIIGSLNSCEITGDLEGHSLAAIIRGEESGPTLLLRCDTDALPIPESMDIPYGSDTPGVSHKCGHDGHMAIMIGVAAELAERGLEKGRAVLLFQSEEETGSGAAGVIGSSGFRELRPDMAFAMHNLPGFPQGSVILGEGTFASASSGLTVTLKGASSHASQPHLGRSPAMAAAQIVQSFASLPQRCLPMNRGARVTVVHVKVGEEAFGTSPGEGTIRATFRSLHGESMEVLRRRGEEICRGIASAWNLECELTWSQEFPSTVNDERAVSIVMNSARELGLDMVRIESPFPWSEDFGHFSALCPSCLFGLGAGTDHCALHSPHYDFPDGLITTGVSILTGIAKRFLSSESPEQ